MPQCMGSPRGRHGRETEQQQSRKGNNSYKPDLQEKHGLSGISQLGFQLYVNQLCPTGQETTLHPTQRPDVQEVRILFSSAKTLDKAGILPALHSASPQAPPDSARHVSPGESAPTDRGLRTQSRDQPGGSPVARGTKDTGHVVVVRMQSFHSRGS